MASQESARTRKFTRGFTLVEVMVVISIIGILMGLLMPAIQAARESSRRSRCATRQRELAIAISGYRTTFQKLPAGAVDWNGDSSSAGGQGPIGHSWLSNVLPYLGEQALFEKIDFKKNSLQQTAEGRKVMTSIIEVLECPTDVGSFADKDHNLRHSRRRSFVVNYGNTNLVGEDLPEAEYKGGPFKLGKPVYPERIKDGLSSTVLCSEIIMPTYPRKNRWQGYLGIAHEAAGSGFSGYLTPNSSAFDQTVKGPDDLYGYPGWTATTGSWQEASSSSFYAARSLHFGGVNVAMCDGSTKFVSQSIDWKTWQAAVTSQGSDHYASID